MLRGMPHPIPDYDTAAFWDAIAEERFVFQRCNACGATRWPPGPMCPECQSTEHTWEQASGAGTVYSWIVVTHPTHSAVVDQVPYTVLLVDLAEGPRVVGNLIGEGVELSDGMPVSMIFERDGERVLPNFVPA